MFWQGEVGCFNRREDIDDLARRCLAGTATTDGGGVGIPIANEGKGAFFWIALASGALNERRSTGGAALALRAASMRLALLGVDEFLSTSGYLAEFCSGQLFEAKEHAMVDRLTGCQWPMDMPPDVARLYYLCAVKNHCGRYKCTSQAVLPWYATVLRLGVRVFNPGTRS